MYAIALSVAACLRARTRVDVAWAVTDHDLGAFDPADAVALTPGGGRIGSLLSGALDGQLSDMAGRISGAGRLAELDVSPVDAAIAGLPRGGRVRCVLTPASALPDELWPLLIDRQPVCLVSTLDGDTVTDTTLHTTETINTVGAIAQHFDRGDSHVTRVGDTVITMLRPTTKLVIVGSGPMVTALRAAAALLGWRTEVADDGDMASGLIAGVSAMDNVVVMAHDLETAGRALAAALNSDAGYIGALGSRAMQQTRADWLAYRGVTDLDRIHGPAGLDIGARTPAEVAVAILAEALAERNGSTSTSATST